MGDIARGERVESEDSDRGVRGLVRSALCRQRKARSYESEFEVLFEANRSLWTSTTGYLFLCHAVRCALLCCCESGFPVGLL